MSQDLARLRRQLARVKPWVAVAAILGLVLFGYYTFQGTRYYKAQGIPFIATEGIPLTGSEKLPFIGPEAIRFKAPKGLIPALTQEKTDIDAELAQNQPDVESILAELEGRKQQLKELRGDFRFTATDDLLKVVSDTSRETDVNLTTITTGELKAETLNETVYRVRPISMSLQGKTADFNRFLSIIQEKIPVVGVPEIQFAALGDNPTARLTLVFYLLPEETQQQAPSDKDQ